MYVRIRFQNKLTVKADFHFSEFGRATGMITCSSIEKKQSDWLSLILVVKKLNLIQLAELIARSPVNTCFQHALIAHLLVARPNSPKWKPAFTSLGAFSILGRWTVYTARNMSPNTKYVTKYVIRDFSTPVM